MEWSEQPPAYEEAIMHGGSLPTPPPVMGGSMLSAPGRASNAAAIDFDAWGNMGDDDSEDERKGKKMIKRDPDAVLDESSTEDSDDDVAAVPMQRQAPIKTAQELLKESGSLFDLMAPSVPSSIPSAGFGNLITPTTHIKVEGGKTGPLPTMPTNLPPSYNRPVRNHQVQSFPSASLSGPVGPMKVEGGLPKAIVCSV